MLQNFIIMTNWLKKTGITDTLPPFYMLRLLQKSPRHVLASHYFGQDQLSKIEQDSSPFSPGFIPTVLLVTVKVTHYNIR